MSISFKITLLPLEQKRTIALVPAKQPEEYIGGLVQGCSTPITVAM